MPQERAGRSSWCPRASALAESELGAPAPRSRKQRVPCSPGVRAQTQTAARLPSSFINPVATSSLSEHRFFMTRLCFVFFFPKELLPFQELNVPTTKPKTTEMFASCVHTTEPVRFSRGPRVAPGVQCIAAPLRDQWVWRGPTSEVQALSAPEERTWDCSVLCLHSRHESHGLTLLVSVSGPRDERTDGWEGDAGHGGHGPRGPHHPAGRATKPRRQPPVAPRELWGLQNPCQWVLEGCPPQYVENSI